MSKYFVVAVDEFARGKQHNGPPRKGLISLDTPPEPPLYGWDDDRGTSLKEMAQDVAERARKDAKELAADGKRRSMADPLGVYLVKRGIYVMPEAEARKAVLSDTSHHGAGHSDKDEAAPPPSSPSPAAIDTKVETLAIPLARIHTSEVNPRKTFPDDTDLDSMATVGLIQPIRVRPSAKKLGDFDLVCGERRLRKAKKLGWLTIRCEVQSLTDVQAREVAIIENLARKDVPPLEEAEAFEVLLDELEMQPEEIAKRVGRSKVYVLERVKLLGLCPEAKAALAKEDLRLGAAFWLCRLLSHDEQRELLPRLARGMKDPTSSWTRALEEPATISAARDLVLRAMRNLRDAPFDVKDAELVAAAGACVACPKRTGAAPDLFGAVKSTDDACTDAACWRSKIDANNAKKLEAVKAKGLPVFEPKAKESIWVQSYAGAEWRLKKGASVVDLEDTEYHEKVTPEGWGKNLKWAAVVKGRDVEIKTAIDDGGKAHQVVSRKRALECVKEWAREQKKKKAAKSPAGKAAAAAAKMPSLKERVLAAKKRAILEAVAAAAKKKPVAVLRAACREAADESQSFRVKSAGEIVAERRGLTDDMALHDLIDRMKDVGELASLLAELRAADDEGWAEENEDELGYDLDQIMEAAEERETEAFGKEKEPPAPKKTKARAKAE